MRVSVIVTFYKQVNILDLCLSNLIENTGNKYEYEVIIVNDNPDMDLGYIKNKFNDKCDISVANLKINSGYSAACNYGVSIAKYEYIVLMDCDIIPQKFWLEELVNTYQNEQNPGAVSSKIIEADTNKLFGYGIGIYDVDILLYKRHGNLDEFSEQDRHFAMVSSGCLFMEKSLYTQLNGQDEKFLNADNDLDLTYRIHLLGKANVMCAKSIVYHRGHVSGNIRVLPFRQDSRAWLFKKWGDRINTDSMNILGELYGRFDTQSLSKNMILVNFSNSLSRHDYTDKIADALKLNYLQKYDFKNTSLSDNIFINDYLTWDICRTNISILYFTDDYRVLENNAFWFKNRVCNDAVFDKNGNCILMQTEN